MDPNTARHVLRLDPFSPVTAETVEAAYAREAWARHPSLYPDAAGREAATTWAMTLAEARATLLQSTASPDVATWASPDAGTPPTPGRPAPIDPRAHAVDTVVSTASEGAAVDVPGGRRRRTRLVVGIVAASAVVIALVVGAGFAATKLAEQVVDQISVLAEQPEWTGETVRYSAEETFFTFPAALEEYYDGRYWAECPEEFAGACWQMAVIPEASCGSLAVDLEFANNENAWTSDEQQTLAFTGVGAGNATPVVFGHHEYDWAWIADVRCLDDTPVGVPPSRDSIAADTPLTRLEAGRWAADDSGFRFRTSLEVYDDGRLDALCPAGFARGCWQMVLTPERACGNLEIRYSLGNGGDAELSMSTWRPGGVATGEPVEVAFGHDDYEYGWITEVNCRA